MCKRVIFGSRNQSLGLGHIGKVTSWRMDRTEIERSSVRLRPGLIICPEKENVGIGPAPVIVTFSVKHLARSWWHPRG